MQLWIIFIVALAGSVFGQDYDDYEDYDDYDQSEEDDDDQTNYLTGESDYSNYGEKEENDIIDYATDESEDYDEGVGDAARELNDYDFDSLHYNTDVDIPEGYEMMDAGPDENEPIDEDNYNVQMVSRIPGFGGGRSYSGRRRFGFGPRRRFVGGMRTRQSYPISGKEFGGGSPYSPVFQSLIGGARRYPSRWGSSFYGRPHVNRRYFKSYGQKPRKGYRKKKKFFQPPVVIIKKLITGSTTTLAAI